MRANIAGYILAGGKGTRMGGMDKLSLKYQGRYLALWTIEALSMLDTWYAYERAGRPVFFQDRNKIFPFPGIYTKSMLPAMERQRKAGIYRMQSLFDLVDRGKITLLDGSSELGRLVNLNTWQEYESLQRRSNEREMRYGTRGAE